MTKIEAKAAGVKQAADGKMTTPHDCREFDAKAIAFSKTQERPFKVYAQLRGAFNRGWEEQHFKMVA